MPNRTATSFDDLRIAYAVSGAADSAMVFVHGALADRWLWDWQYAAFVERSRQGFTDKWPITAHPVISSPSVYRCSRPPSVRRNFVARAPGAWWIETSGVPHS